MQRELGGIAGVGDGGGCVVVVARERREREERVDADADEAGGGGFAGGARGGGAGVAAIAAGELEARDDHERGGELDRAVCALGEDGGVARELEREADIAGGEGDLGGGEAAVELVARLGARVLRELDRARRADRRARARPRGGPRRGAGGGVERGRAVQLLEARQRGVEAELEQIDRGDDGGAARGEVPELAAHARCEGGGGELGGERGLAAQDLELGEIELGTQGA